MRNRAFEIKRQRLEAHGQSQAIQMIRPPSKNWPDGFLERHKRELQIEKLRGIGWRPKALPWGEEIANFAASLSDMTYLCSKCAKIQASLKKVLARAQPNESRRPHFFENFAELSVHLRASSASLPQLVRRAEIGRMQAGTL